MSAYDVLGRYYDVLMRDVDYDARAAYLLALAARLGLSQPGTALDLACGTGSLTLELARRVPEVVAADASEAMLSQAYAKTASLPAGRVLLLKQEMTALDLYGTVDLAVCTLDGVNHLLTPEDVRRAFSRVALFLEPGGLFLFDVNTPWKFKNVLKNEVFVYDIDEVYCVWQNAFDEKSGLCRFDLTFFEPDGETYRREDESFAERAYEKDELCGLIKEAGLAPIGCFADLSFEAPGGTEPRAVFAARKEQNGWEN